MMQIGGLLKIEILSFGLIMTRRGWSIQKRLLIGYLPLIVMLGKLI
jgi:hypothetical protein